MEDIMKALLDVVRAQHSATEGSEEKPFDINDIIDMAMNITGRPEEPAEQRELSDTIQKMAESMAPDIFPPKTFEEMDDSERAASAVNMIEERLKNGGRRREEAQQPVQPVQAPEAVSQPEPEPVQPQVQAEAISASQPETEQQTFNNEDYGNGNAYDMFGQDDVNPQEAANLNDLIYNNFMQMMGLNDPKVEYPSLIVLRSATEERKQQQRCLRRMKRIRRKRRAFEETEKETGFCMGAGAGSCR